MSFFISDALAANGAPTPGAGSAVTQVLLLGGMIAVFYFLLIRPQAKKAKDHRKMVDELAKGDEVATNGGLLGRIIDIGDTFLTLEIAEGTEVKVQKTAVASVMPKGTLRGKEKKGGKQ